MHFFCHTVYKTYELSMYANLPFIVLCKYHLYAGVLLNITNDERDYNLHIDYYIQEGREEMHYLTMHSTHFIYGYIASDIW